MYDLNGLYDEKADVLGIPKVFLSFEGFIPELFTGAEGCYLPILLGCGTKYKRD